MTILEQMRAKWEGAGRGAADERAPLLANWYLGYRHAWWEAMEMAKPEPARQAVTREAVMRAVTGASDLDCRRLSGDCGGKRACKCDRTIDAIMALIGGEA